MSSNTTLSFPRRPFPDIATSELFMHFRCNNNPLSEFEAQVFKDQTLSAALGNLSAVESHIEDLESQLAAAVAERGRCQQTVDECHGVLSSLRGFPPEILTEIFRWSCIMSNNVVDIAQGPWLISHVCSVWRRIVLSTPSLWIYISLCNSFLLHNRRTYPSDSCALLRAALSRSKDLLLRVNFRKDIDLEGGAHGAARRINNDWLDIVMGASERWQHCYFYFHQGAGDERRLAVVKGRINQLETLGVQFSSAFRSAVVEVVDTFQIAPKLWSVEFYEVNCHRFKLPLAQLTRVREYWDRILFEGQDMGPPPQKPLDSLQRYMAYSPALRHLHLAHHLLSKHPSYDAPLISHTLLRSLTITDEYLLDILDLPSLEELNIKSRFCPLRDSGHNDDIPDCPRGCTNRS
ncbi:hypothetical protein BDZ89DRAFT_769901 [Hymenopellis radicata]|nr:hypothetical protein BDZ89DRAFT_769901 [Hymenopellis radicata]